MIRIDGIVKLLSSKLIANAAGCQVYHFFQSLFCGLHLFEAHAVFRTTATKLAVVSNKSRSSLAFVSLFFQRLSLLSQFFIGAL
jgi:hypothetical protein